MMDFILKDWKKYSRDNFLLCLSSRRLCACEKLTMVSYASCFVILRLKDSLTSLGSQGICRSVLRTPKGDPSKTRIPSIYIAPMLDLIPKTCQELTLESTGTASFSCPGDTAFEALRVLCFKRMASRMLCRVLDALSLSTHLQE